MRTISEDIYSPVLSYATTAASGSTVVTEGSFMRIGNVVNFYVKATLTAVGTGGEGVVRISLPSKYVAKGRAHLCGGCVKLACPTSTNYLLATVNANGIQVVGKSSDGATSTLLTFAELADGSVIEVFGSYVE